jgi:predicted nuclease of predicted toxin-antitoxin system
VRFLVDNQLPAALARFLKSKGHDASHVLDIGMAQSEDHHVWAHAAADGSIVVSKDEDFLHLAQQARPPGRLLWVRLKNCRNAALLAAFGNSLADVVTAFNTGQTIVELRS